MTSLAEKNSQGRKNLGEISPLRRPTRSQEANVKEEARPASVEMTVWVMGLTVRGEHRLEWRGGLAGLGE
jgi:hypothetical protein